MAVAFLDRPKGMHRMTYKRLHAAHDQAAERCMAGLKTLAYTRWALNRQADEIEGA